MQGERESWCVIGGGMLGWTLGHNDFAPEEQVADYLGLHVSLTGLRGLVAPLIGVWVYWTLERAGPGLGRWALLLPLAFSYFVIPVLDWLGSLPKTVLDARPWLWWRAPSATCTSGCGCAGAAGGWTWWWTRPGCPACRCTWC